MEMTPAALYGIITFQLHTIYIHTSENEEHHIACFYQNKCGLVLKYIGYGLTISVTDDRNRKYQEYE